MSVFVRRKCLKAILFLCLLIFIGVNFHVLINPIQSGLTTEAILHPDPPNEHQVTHKLVSVASNNAPNITEAGNQAHQVKTQAGAQPDPPEVKKEDNSEAARKEIFNESMRFVINDINSRQGINNGVRFPPHTNGTYSNVFVVQIHNRDYYLEHLIRSLKNVQGIERVLLILSHDFYSKPVFDIISSIDFMPFMQIFYPFAMQLYHDRYPGPDPADCPRNVKRPEAERLGCVNALHPDRYGHYREAAYSQTKLHWFWKLHRIFEELNVMKDYQGYVTLLEEDHYVTPDALHMLTLMISLKPTMCGDCKIFTLGNYDKKPTYAFHNEIVVAPDFISSKHNMAMSFNREVYSLIKQHAKEFCEYDDYNWDWTIQYLGKDVVNHLRTMIVKTPRVYHIGECGVHFKGKKCDPVTKTKPINDLVSSNPTKLFPETLVTGKPTSNTFLPIKKMKPNGGWGDIRDHKLCISFMNPGSGSPLT